MFLANSLQEKIKKNILENNGDLIPHAKYPYIVKDKDPRQLISTKKSEMRNLTGMDKDEWEKSFNVNDLKKTWETKIEVNFDKKHKKFSDDIIKPSVLEARKFVHEIRDPDILEVNQKRWNISTNPCELKRPELKQIVFEVNHGLRDFTVVPLKNRSIEEGTETRDRLIIDGVKWNLSTKFENEERKFNEQRIKEEATENGINYWNMNDENRRNKKPFPVSEDRKKIEVIRYFQKYRTPFQNTAELYKTMNKVKELTENKRSELEEDVKYRYPGTEFPEKIKGVVHKEMYKIYLDKYNELTGKLDKKEIKRRQLEQNKFKWNDKDLMNKILMVSSIDKKNLEWFKPKYSKEACLTEEKRLQELLKPLVSQGNDIYLEEEKLKEIAEEELKKQQKRELMLKEKCSSRFNRAIVESSRYPVSEELYQKTLKEMSSLSYDENGDKLKNKPPYQINSDLDNYFFDSYKKIAKMSTDDKNKHYNKIKDNIEYQYSHPGTYREFDFSKRLPPKKVLQVQKTEDEDENDDEYDNNNEDPELNKFNSDQNQTTTVTDNQVNLPLIKVNKEKDENLIMAWSCCMNVDEKSPGCQKTIVKKFRWLLDHA